MSATSSPLRPSAHPRRCSQPGGEGSSHRPPLQERPKGTHVGMWGAGRVLPLQALTLPSSATPRLSAMEVGFPPHHAPPWPAGHHPWCPIPSGDEAPNPWSGDRGTGQVSPPPAPSGRLQQCRCQEPRAARRPFTKICPFSPPISAFSPSRGGGDCHCWDFRVAVYGVLPPSRLQSRAGGFLKWEAAFPTLLGTSLLWKKDLAKGLWHWEIPPPPPPAPLGAGHPRLRHRW